MAPQAAPGNDVYISIEPAVTAEEVRIDEVGVVPSRVLDCVVELALVVS